MYQLSLYYAQCNFSLFFQLKIISRIFLQSYYAVCTLNEIQFKICTQFIFFTEQQVTLVQLFLKSRDFLFSSKQLLICVVTVLSTLTNSLETTIIKTHSQKKAFLSSSIPICSSSQLTAAAASQRAEHSNAIIWILTMTTTIEISQLLNKLQFM